MLFRSRPCRLQVMIQGAAVGVADMGNNMGVVTVVKGDLHQVARVQVGAGHLDMQVLRFGNIEFIKVPYPHMVTAAVDDIPQKGPAGAKYLCLGKGVVRFVGVAKPLFGYGDTITR